MKGGGKKLLFLTIGLFAIIFATNFILAQDALTPPLAQPVSLSQGVTDLVQGIKDIFSPIFAALFGSEALSSDGSTLTIQILMFFLVTLVVYGVLSTMGIFGGKPWVNTGVGILVAILGIRFIPVEFLSQAALPSSALVLAITMGVPFIVAAVLITRIQGELIRRALWVGYGVILFVLWMYNVASNTSLPTSAKWVYPLILIACGFAFAFDGTLQKFMGQAKGEKWVEKTKNIQRDRIISEIRDLQGALAAAVDPADVVRIKKELTQKRNALKALA